MTYNTTQLTSLRAQLPAKMTASAASAAPGKIVDKEKQDAELKKSCADFEAILIQSMLKSMRDTLPGDALFGKSMSRDIYQSMYDQELATNVAQGHNNLGIGEALFNQLERHQPDLGEKHGTGHGIMKK